LLAFHGTASGKLIRQLTEHKGKAPSVKITAFKFRTPILQAFLFPVNFGVQSGLNKYNSYVNLRFEIQGLLW